MWVFFVIICNMKILEKEKAKELRKSGYSLSEISSTLKVSKSTASLWTKHVKINQIGADRIKEKSKSAISKVSDILHKRKLERLSMADLEAEKMISKFKLDTNTVIVALSIMYWCEGSKDDGSVRFTNSDPDLVKIFIKLFRQCFPIDEKKIKITVHLHDYHNEKEILEFWSLATNIPLSQFNKPFRKESKHTFKKEGYKGCVRINYHDSHITRVIQLFAKKLAKHYI